MTSPAISYVVRIAFTDRASMLAIVAWLRDRHVADVVTAGADGAELVLLDEAHGHVVEARYRFASRDAFARYEREEAPRLRAEGLAEIGRLGIALDAVTFTRTTGEIVLTH